MLANTLTHTSGHAHHACKPIQTCLQTHPAHMQTYSRMLTNTLTTLADPLIHACTAVKSSGGPGGSETKMEHLPDIVPETGETVSLCDWHVCEDAVCEIR